MDENKNLENLEEVTEAPEAAEEVVEEVAEEAAEAIEEAVEAIEEVAEAVEETVEEVAQEVEDAVDAEAVAFADQTGDFEVTTDVVEEVITQKKSKSGVVVAIILVVAIVAAACVWFFMPKNKYNKMGYVDISGKTVQDLADQMGVDLATFLAQYELPADMPADTSESAAYYNIPVKIMAQMFGMDYATMKETLHFPETITEDSTWGEAEGEVTLQYYVGEENLASFKEQYGFGDEVTLETKWKDVRFTIDSAQKEARIEQEKAMAEAEKEAEQGAEAETEADVEVEAEPEAEPEGEAEAPAETPAE